MDDNISSTLKGHFLIAMPGLTDPNFYRSVTCITEHTSEGAVGVVINQNHSFVHGRMIFEELGIHPVLDQESIPVYSGGPVHTNEVFVLHGPPLKWDGSLLVNSELALSNSKDILESIAQKKGPRQFMICLGCAGWGPGQLEFEIKENAWLTIPCSMEIIFTLPSELRWRESIQQIGIDPDSLTQVAGHA